MSKRLLCVFGVAFATAIARPAQAFENQWHLGAEAQSRTPVSSLRLSACAASSHSTRPAATLPGPAIAAVVKGSSDGKVMPAKSSPPERATAPGLNIT
jgi:hypothetical protein